MPIFYDTHAHLDFPDFASDLPEVIERAQAAGISMIISIGTDLESSQRALQISEQFSNVFAAVGWHPTHALEAPADLRPSLRQLARHPKVVAIGETGFDYHRLPSQQPGGNSADGEGYRSKQAQVFEQQLEVATELGLNCVVHQRDALEDTLAMMQKFVGRTRGVFHCFANDAAAMERIVGMGSLVSCKGSLDRK